MKRYYLIQISKDRTTRYRHSTGYWSDDLIDAMLWSDRELVFKKKREFMKMDKRDAKNGHTYAEGTTYIIGEAEVKFLPLHEE